MDDLWDDLSEFGSTEIGVQPYASQQEAQELQEQVLPLDTGDGGEPPSHLYATRCHLTTPQPASGSLQNVNQERLNVQMSHRRRCCTGSRRLSSPFWRSSLCMAACLTSPWYLQQQGSLHRVFPVLQIVHELLLLGKSASQRDVYYRHVPPLRLAKIHGHQ